MKFNLYNSFLLRSENEKKAELFGLPSSLLPQKRVKALKIAALCSYFVMLAMQLYALFSFDGKPWGDAWRYTTDALECARAGVWYPTAADFSVLGGAAGTGFVNYLVLLFRISENMRLVYFANLLLVQLILFSTLYIAKKITHSDTVQYVTAVLFCLFGTYWSEICIARTEIFFTALAFLSLALAVQNKKAGVVFSGIILAYANWARPLGISFFVAIIWFFIVLRARPGSYIRFISGFAAAVLALSCLNYINGGVFSYQPSVASGNLLMGANDDADGSYNSTVFSEGKAGFISEEQARGMTYKDVNKVYSDAAKSWIKANPKKYLSLVPKKFFYLYATETYSGDVWFDNQIPTGGMSYIKTLFGILTGNGERALAAGDVIIMYNQAFYMLVFLLFLIGVVFSMKNGYWRSMSFLYGIVLIATAMCLVTLGAARYHFPYLPIMFITAAQFIDSALVRRRAKKSDLSLDKGE